MSKPNLLWMRGDTRRETCRKNSLPLRRERNLKVLSHMEAVLGAGCPYSGNEASCPSDFQLLKGFRAVGGRRVLFQEQGDLSESIILRMG